MPRIPKTPSRPDKQGSASSRMLKRYRFSLELEFPGDLEVETETLLETIPDAIHECDARHRLLPSVPPPPGGERLIGSSIGLEGVERKPDPLAGTREWTPTHGFTASERERNEVLDISLAIDRQIDALRDAQADLWAAYHLMTDATDDDALAKAKRSGKKAIGRATKVLKPNGRQGAAGPRTSES